MPTPETAETFAKLVAARARLNEITKQLNEAHAELSAGGRDARSHHADLQAEWDAAFRDFEVATENFSAAVKKLPDEIGVRRPQNQQA